MSEAELHILKQRMLEGKRIKAERGELSFSVPIGYGRRPSGKVRLDPDEQVQQVVTLIFRKFEKIETLNGVLRTGQAPDPSRCESAIVYSMVRKSGDGSNAIAIQQTDVS